MFIGYRVNESPLSYSLSIPNFFHTKFVSDKKHNNKNFNSTCLKPGTDSGGDLFWEIAEKCQRESSFVKRAQSDIS
jgi:hypothetical protein